VAARFETERALSVPKCTGWRGLYKTLGADGFVEAARFVGGHLSRLHRSILMHNPPNAALFFSPTFCNNP
jgi:hypothetical protein